MCEETQCRYDESLTTDVDVFISRGCRAAATCQCFNVVFNAVNLQGEKYFLSQY